MMREHEIDRLITAAHDRHDCPPSMKLGDTSLAPDEAAQIAGHLAVCTHCQADMAIFATFLSAVEVEIESAAAAVQSSWQKAIGYQWKRVQATGKLMIRLVDETLTPASSTTASVPILAAVKSGRSAQLPQSDHILREIALTSDATGSIDVSAVAYATAPDETGCTVVVRVQIPERWPDLAGVDVRVAADDWSAEQITNDDGEVMFEDVPAGVLDGLTIEVL